MSEELTELKENVKDLHDRIENLGSSDKNTQPIPQPDFPQEHELDQYESLYVDAILWREDAAQTKIKYAKTEIDSCKLMRQNLMTRLVARLGIDLETHSVSINQDTRRLTVVKRK